MAKKISVMATPDLTSVISPELIGQAIRAKRTQSQLRLEDAAALCGVAKQTYMNVEHGSHTTQLGIVLTICAALGVELTITAWNGEEGADDWG